MFLLSFYQLISKTVKTIKRTSLRGKAPCRTIDTVLLLGEHIYGGCNEFTCYVQTHTVEIKKSLDFTCF